MSSEPTDLSHSDGGSRRVDVDDEYMADVMEALKVKSHNREKIRLRLLNDKSLASSAFDRKYLAISTRSRTDREIVGLFCQGAVEVIAEAWLHEGINRPRPEFQLRVKALKYLLLHFLPFEKLLKIGWIEIPELQELISEGYRLRKATTTTRGTAVLQDEIFHEVISDCAASARRRASDLGWKRDLQRDFELDDEGNQFGWNDRFWQSPQFWQLIRAIRERLGDLF